MKVIKVQRISVFEINSCVLISGSNLISFYKNKKLHNEYGFAIVYKNVFGDWYYKGDYYGGDNNFTIKSWKQKVKELKYLESLKIFI